jgi:hypothetical protein
MSKLQRAQHVAPLPRSRVQAVEYVTELVTNYTSLVRWRGKQAC